MPAGPRNSRQHSLTSNHQAVISTEGPVQNILLHIGTPAKARTEGRFPGRRPSLTGQQREYIKEERSKGVSQRELAKRLEVSRWTIQQVDG